MTSLTGIQPTNILHIGNLFGALKPAVELQEESQLVMMIVDYHAITVAYDPEALRKNILFAAATYIAAGIDPKKTLLFQQSAVSAHTELAWILQSVARMGEAERMTQFKDKSQKGGADRASVGLFTYPVLMAADILLYDADVVPVGDDQKQHVEFARDLAERFNRDYGHTFTIPEPRIKAHGARIKSLTEPEKKMSKSAASAKSYISLMDEEDIIVKKIRSAVTDSLPGIQADDNRPGLKNLLTTYSLLSKESLPDIAARYDGLGMKQLKDDLAQLLTVYLTPLQAEIKGLLHHEDELKKILAGGAESANEIANAKLANVKSRMGLVL